MKIAERVYRPDTVSIAEWSIPDDQETLRQWWSWAGTKITFIGRTTAEELAARAKMRKGEYTITAHKRQGHFQLYAIASDEACDFPTALRLRALGIGTTSENS